MIIFPDLYLWHAHLQLDLLVPSEVQHLLALRPGFGPNLGEEEVSIMVI